MRWWRGRERAKALFKRQQMDEFLSGRKDGYHPWESEGVSNTARDSFYYEKNLGFLKLKILLSLFTKIDQVTNFSDLKQRTCFGWQDI